MAEAQSNSEQAIKILITDRIAQEGIDLLHSQLPEAQIDERIGLKAEQLKPVIGDYMALIVRSETQVTGDILAAAKRLKIVGRAGVGVDNIDTEAATRLGIMVVNSPTGNIVAAAPPNNAILIALPCHPPVAHSTITTRKSEENLLLAVVVSIKPLVLHVM